MPAIADLVNGVGLCFARVSLLREDTGAASSWKMFHYSIRSSIVCFLYVKYISFYIAVVKEGEAGD